MIDVWIIDSRSPLRRVRHEQATLSTDKGGASWAHLPNGTKRKVGVTAFLTEKAAEQRRAGLCAAKLVPTASNLYQVHFKGLDVQALRRVAGPQPIFTKRIK